MKQFNLFLLLGFLLISNIVFSQLNVIGGFAAGAASPRTPSFSAENLLFSASKDPFISTNRWVFISNDGRLAVGFPIVNSGADRMPNFQAGMPYYALQVKGDVKLTQLEKTTSLDQLKNMYVTMQDANGKLYASHLTLGELFTQLAPPPGGGSTVKTILILHDNENTAARLMITLGGYAFQSKFPGSYIAASFDHGINNTTVTAQSIMDAKLLIVTHGSTIMTPETRIAIQNRIAANKPTLLMPENTNNNHTEFRTLLGLPNTATSFHYSLTNTLITFPATTDPLIEGTTLFGKVSPYNDAEMMYWTQTATTCPNTLGVRAASPNQIYLAISGNRKVICFANETDIAGTGVGYYTVPTNSKQTLSLNILGELLK